jgi:hypothetical protein
LPFVQELTERDRKLFNFAKKEISKAASELNIKNATVCIECTASLVEGLESMTSNPVTSLAWVPSPGDALVV